MWQKKKKQAECVLVRSGSQNPRFLCFLCSSQNEQEGMLFLRVQGRPGGGKPLLQGEALDTPDSLFTAQESLPGAAI